MTAIHDFPTSAAIHEAKAALASPHGRSKAELAGHILILDCYGTKEDAANARDFAASQPYRDDLALWLDIALAPACPTAEESPDVTIANVIRRNGLLRSIAGGVSVVGLAWLLLTWVLA
jgi:hypothetical protein